MSELRVMTYNVYGARYPDPLREVVTRLAPDVLVVNETPKTPMIWRRGCDRLAASWRMRRAGGGRDAGSNMVCVSDRVSVEGVWSRRLRQPRFAPRRGVVAVQCSMDGVMFGVVGVHLSLLADSRPREAAAALADAARLRGPLIVAGDFNERPSGPCWRLFAAAGLVDHAAATAYTSTAREPAKRIDGLLVRGLEVSDHAVPRLPGDVLARASDHLPVLARIRLRPEPGRA